MRAALVLACGLLLCAACASARGSGPLTPDQVCARSRKDARIRLSDTQFVACYKQTVWEVRSCPTNLRFDPISQACVPA